MDEWLTRAGRFAETAAGSGVIAAAGVALFVLLGLYAALLLNADRLPHWLRLPMPATLKSRLTIALVLVATLPAISLALVLSDRASERRIEQAALAMNAEAAGLSRTLEYLIDKTGSGIAALAQHIRRAGGRTRNDLELQLERHHQMAPGVESMAVVGRDGTILAATIRDGDQIVAFGDAAAATEALAGFAEPPADVSVSGSAVEPLRGQRPAILIAAPLVGDDGRPWATVVGAFDPASVSALESWTADAGGGGMVVIDGAMRVVTATPGSGFEAGRDAGGSPLMKATRAAAAYFVFEGPAERLVGAASASPRGWTIVRYLPLDSLQAARMQEFAVAAGWLLAALIISVCLSVALAGSISGPLRALDTAVRQFDPERPRERSLPPADAPREISMVWDHLATVGEQLRESYGQLRESVLQGERLRNELIQVIDSREHDIENRTIQLKEANAALERLTRVDALTGIANRRAFTEFLDKAWRVALRDRQPVSIVMIDIDHFKAYNDAYGHQQGDVCIRAVAEAICQVVGRATDIVARYGGEEFVAVLGNTPLEGALAVGEQLRAAVAALAIPHKGVPSRAIVTVSVGVTSTLPTRGSRPETTVVAADRALYAAKEQGRNQVGYSSAARTGLFQSLCLPNEQGGRPS